MPRKYVHLGKPSLHFFTLCNKPRLQISEILREIYLLFLLLLRGYDIQLLLRFSSLDVCVIYSCLLRHKILICVD